MKIIQTFWSAPARHNSKEAIGGRNSGGWLNERYHAIGWTLSCLNFRQHYPDITLYTDTEGADWLCNFLGLPYKYVSTELDSLSGYNPLLWALPKVYAYGRQSEPFLHVDGDVFIWQPFDKAIERCGLVAQNYETHTDFYREIMNQVERSFDYIPRELEGINVPGQPIRAINAGVLGGCNVDFFRSYAEAAFDFVDRNKAKLDAVDLGMFNPVFEQLLFMHRARVQELPIQVVFDEESTQFQRILQASTVPMLNTFIHTVAGAKRNPLICLELEARLKYEHPKFYQHINELYMESHGISITFAVGGKKRLRLSETPLVPAGDEDKWARPEELSQSENLSSEEELLLDLQTIEEAYTLLRRQAVHDRSGADLLFDRIVQGLPLLYEDDMDAFFRRPFVLASHYRVLLLNRAFDEALDGAYLQSLVSGKAPARGGKPCLMLMESHDAELVYSYLEGWETLLYYFEEEPVTGLELLDLLLSGETPFSVSTADAAMDVFNFLVTECYIQKRLQPVFSHSDA